MSILTRTVWCSRRSSPDVTELSGEGSRRYDGRWHKAGSRVIYTASSRSLAFLEAAVHVDLAMGARSRVLIPITMPVGRVRISHPSEFPSGWQALPQGQVARAWGDAWFRAEKTLAVAVPSVLLDGSSPSLDAFQAGEFNVLLNPAILALADVKVGTPIPFPLNPRTV